MANKRDTDNHSPASMAAAQQPHKESGLLGAQKHPSKQYLEEQEETQGLLKSEEYSASSKKNFQGPITSTNSQQSAHHLNAARNDDDDEDDEGTEDDIEEDGDEDNDNFEEEDEEEDKEEKERSSKTKPSTNSAAYSQNGSFSNKTSQPHNKNNYQSTHQKPAPIDQKGKANQVSPQVSQNQSQSFKKK